MPTGTPTGLVDRTDEHRFLHVPGCLWRWGDADDRPHRRERPERPAEPHAGIYPGSDGEPGRDRDDDTRRFTGGNHDEDTDGLSKCCAAGERGAGE